jgi:hypothetical protein
MVSINITGKAYPRNQPGNFPKCNSLKFGFQIFIIVVQQNSNRGELKVFSSMSFFSFPMIKYMEIQSPSRRKKIYQSHHQETSYLVFILIVYFIRF